MASFFRSRDKAPKPPAEDHLPRNPPEHFDIEADPAIQRGVPPEQRASNAEPDPQPAPAGAPIDPALLEQIAALRVKLHETFGKVALAMMTVPRYRHLPIGDLTTLILDPLVRDRIAMATPKQDGMPDASALSGFAIWASVSPDVDAKIVDQIQAGTFPIRLQSADWTSGKTFWLLDVIAPTPALAAAVIANFGQVIAAARGEDTDGELELRLHPIVARLVDRETLERIGVRAVERPAAKGSAG